MLHYALPTNPIVIISSSFGFTADMKHNYGRHGLIPEEVRVPLVQSSYRDTLALSIPGSVLSANYCRRRRYDGPRSNRGSGCLHRRTNAIYICGRPNHGHRTTTVHAVDPAAIGSAFAFFAGRLYKRGKAAWLWPRQHIIVVSNSNLRNVFVLLFNEGVEYSASAANIVFLPTTL